MSTLKTYLKKYYEYQDKILLVYRPSEKNSWANRCFYLEEGYQPMLEYNHRGILFNEIVIEYDTDDHEANKKYVDIVAKRLREDGIKCAKWKSGNKSTHLHTLVNVRGAGNIPLLKKVFVRYYSQGLPVPDLRLCSQNHLIRAEYGIHEYTGKRKYIISKDKDYPVVNKIKKEIWDRYYSAVAIVIKRKISIDVNELIEHEGVKYILDTTRFKEGDDGRERALFILIHILKEKYKDKKDELIKYLQEWYKYSGGYKLKPVDIHRKINYHWKRNYSIVGFLNTFLEEIGKEEMIKEK